MTDTDRLAALLYEQEVAGNEGTWPNASDSDRLRFHRWAYRLIAQGVRVGDDGLAEVRGWVASIGATNLDTGRRITKADVLAVIDRLAATEEP